MPNTRLLGMLLLLLGLLLHTAEGHIRGHGPVSSDPGMVATAKSIALFEARVAGAKNDFLNRTILGGLYLRKAEQGGDLAAYAKAESVLRAFRR